MPSFISGGITRAQAAKHGERRHGESHALLAFRQPAATAGTCATAASERAIEKQGVAGAPISARCVEGVDDKRRREGIFAPDAKVEAPRCGGAFEIYMNPYAPAGLKGADDMRFLARAGAHA